MLYAREVMELMAAYPGRDFRMVAIVRYIVGVKPERRRSKSVRAAVRRVLQALVDTGTVEVVEQEKRGSYASYRWKVLHAELQECRA